MSRVIFIDSTKKASKPLYVRLTWYLVAVLSLIAFLIFVYRPDWLLVPPGIK